MKEILLRRGVRAGLAEVSGLVSADRDRGASMADLVRAAEAKGLKASAESLSVEELEAALLSGRGPCIVHMNWGSGHFSVAECVEGRIRLVDHPYRVWRDGLTCLRQAYSGYALFFEPAEPADKPKPKARKKPKGK